MRKIYSAVIISGLMMMTVSAQAFADASDSNVYAAGPGGEAAQSSVSTGTDGNAPLIIYVDDTGSQSQNAAGTAQDTLGADTSSQDAAAVNTVLDSAAATGAAADSTAAQEQAQTQTQTQTTPLIIYMDGTTNAGEISTSGQDTFGETSGQESTGTGEQTGTGTDASAGTATDTDTATASQATGRQIDPTRPMIALTYDDGPQTAVGNQIMDCLAQYGGKATFFMVGDRVASRAAEVQRMVAEGHEVANHTYSHKYLQKQSADVIRQQVSQCNDAIEAACGVRPTIMRLPGGGKNDTVIANTGMPMIQWNIDTRDWEHRDASRTINEVLTKAKDGDVVLMHELYNSTGQASLTIIPELTSRGFQLVTVSEMAAAKGVALNAGQLYYSF